MYTKIVGLAAVLGVSFLAGGILAQASANYDLSWNVLGNGGSEMASANYDARFTVGQAVAGMAEGTSYGLGAGYWLTDESFRLYLPLTLKNH